MDRGALTVAALPSGATTYHYSIIDAPGVVAANNFISLFNPVDSGKNYMLLAIHVNNYATGASGSTASLAKYRISSATGGTLVASNKISRYDTLSILSTAQVRTGNPTVTTTTGTPGTPIAPPISTGAGTNVETIIHTPAGTMYLIHPGEGVAFSTASGNVNQIWDIHLIWCEF